MRAIAVTLVLVFLTGTQARRFWQRDEPQKTVVERMKETTNAFTDALLSGIKGAAAQFDASTMAQKLELNLAEQVDSVQSIVTALHEEVAPHLEALKTQLNANWESLHQELVRDLEEIKGNVLPYMEGLRERVEKDTKAIQAQLEPLRQQLQDQAQQNLDSLHQTVKPVADSVRDKIRHHMNDLRSNLAPYGKDLQQQMHQKVQRLYEKAQQLQEQLQQQQPHVLQGEFRQRLSALQAKVPEVLAKVGEKAGPWLNSAQTRFQDLLTALQSHVEPQQV